jgi:hypothetical protein
LGLCRGPFRRKTIDICFFWRIIFCVICGL